MEEEANQHQGFGFEILIGEAIILRGRNLKELLTTARLMYPDRAIGIRRIYFNGKES